MQAIMSQKDTVLVDLAEDVVALYRSGYRVDHLVAILLCLGHAKSSKAEQRISNAILDLTRRDLQPAGMRPYPWEEARLTTKGGDAHDRHDP